MATPIGHALAGYAVYRSIFGAIRQERRTFLWLCLLMAIAPDLDFVPGILVGQPALYHQGITHSLGFALMVSLGLAVAYGRYSKQRGKMTAYWGGFFLAYTSHLVIDFFGPDGRLPYGQPLFWPLNDSHYLSPVPIFWGVHHVVSTSATTGQWIIAILNPHNLRAIGIEVLVMLPVLLLVWYLRSLSSRCKN